MKDKIFDASAIINIIIRKGPESLKLTKGQNILDLTIYEVGNSIWRLTYLDRKITNAQACSLLDSFLRLTQQMQILRIDDIEKEHAKEISLKEGLTFYDSAYLVLAKDKNSMLVTDDATLRRVASKYVKAISSEDL